MRARIVAFLALLAGCGGETWLNGDELQAEGRQVATLTISPNPVQAGSLAITRPLATGKGFRAGRRYLLRVESGASVTIGTYVQTWVTADRAGGFSWVLEEQASSSGGAQMDGYLASPSATLVARNERDMSIAASLTFPVTPNPGTASVAPQRARPGTLLTVTGGGAQPGASLRAEWWDQTGCSCNFGGCSYCTWTSRSVSLAADASGNFSTPFAPAAANNGYCDHHLSILAPTTNTIVATALFNLCP